MPLTRKYAQLLAQKFIDYQSDFVPAYLYKFMKSHMFQEIIIRYFHPCYNIGLQDIRNAWLLEKTPVKLATTIYLGSLTFRLPSSGRRVSYRSLKKGLTKKTIIIKQPLNLLPF